MREEWHITVVGDQHAWRGFCASIGIKPLRIELSTFEIQLMCAVPGSWITSEYGAHVNPADAMVALHGEIAKKGFKVVRVKREVEAEPNLTPALYYEVHTKLNGAFEPEFHMASRDLFRDDRWYVTHRATHPFDPRFYVELMRSLSNSDVDSFEYEACILDTNPGLDAHWVKTR